jgi:hypothetical protein
VPAGANDTEEEKKGEREIGYKRGAKSWHPGDPVESTYWYRRHKQGDLEAGTEFTRATGKWIGGINRPAPPPGEYTDFGPVALPLVTQPLPRLAHCGALEEVVGSDPLRFTQCDRYALAGWIYCEFCAPRDPLQWETMQQEAELAKTRAENVKTRKRSNTHENADTPVETSPDAVLTLFG